MFRERSLAPGGDQIRRQRQQSGKAGRRKLQ
jgi:hypothetical protein